MRQLLWPSWKILTLKNKNNKYKLPGLIQLCNRIFKVYCVRMTHDPSKEAVDPVVVVAISYFTNAKYTLLYK